MTKPKVKKPAHAVAVVTVTEDRKFELDIEALSGILLRDAIRDLPVVVVSIAGDFRKGKSFLLNHFLRYLQAGGSDAWIGDLQAPLTGFKWRGGSDRETTGILMWSEPFVVKVDEAGHKVGIILMDTQGCFDSEYTIKDSATVFALSTMTSSIQLFNLMHNLQEDNLQVLEIFCEYGRLALETMHSKPFQRLLFLIRDWSYPYDYPYGFTGGQELLDNLLEVNEQMPQQLQRVRRRVKDCFQEIECFLMPHPGSVVATSSKFDGRLADYDPAFLTSLKELVPNMLKPSRLVVKKIGGQKVTGRALLEYFKVYIDIFAGNTMPEPKTMLEATAEVNNLTAVAVVQDLYQSSLDDICGGNRPFINPDLLAARNEEIKARCLEQFDMIPKMGGDSFSVQYKAKLVTALDQVYEQYVSLNKRKNVFSLVGTPLILLGTGLILMMMAKLVDFLGILQLANCLQIFGSFVLALLVAYFMARYTGNYPTLVGAIERVVEKVWTRASAYALQHLLHSQVRQLASSTTDDGSRSSASEDIDTSDVE